MSRRVVVTGIGATSPVGHTLQDITTGLRSEATGIRIQHDWKEVDGLYTHLGAPVEGVDLNFDRKRSRGMGRVSKLALRATLDAIEDSGLELEALQDGSCGVSYGSTQGSSSALVEFCTNLIEGGGLHQTRPSTYIKFMSHTCAVNLSTYLSIKGRVIPTCSACTSGSQGIGYGYEAIKYGMQDRMICGGAEELHYMHSGVFDLLRATSTSFNESPSQSPRPFDARRDGLVVGEGSATLLLEELESARARGARIYCEVVGYGTTCDGGHLTAPDQAGMASAMQLALDDARTEASSVDYVNAHATATIIGDITESHATEDVLGSNTNISSTKGLTGHTLGACGALESIFCIAALTHGFMPSNFNFETLDSRCAELDYVLEPTDAEVSIVMNNNFAFGGVNTSLIFRRI